MIKRRGVGARQHASSPIAPAVVGDGLAEVVEHHAHGVDVPAGNRRVSSRWIGIEPKGIGKKVRAGIHADGDFDIGCGAVRIQPGVDFGGRPLLINVDAVGIVLKKC